VAFRQPSIYGRELASSRRYTSELCLKMSSKKGGNRKRRVPTAPIASCAKVEKAHELVTTGTPEHPALPARWFYDFLRALLGDRAFLPPSPAEMVSANLTPASGRQDHMASPSASAPFVRAKYLRCVAVASIASQPYVRDDRETPLCVGPGCEEQ
jgi:hypothetical protein